MRRCPAGSRRNKKTGNCDPYPPVALVPAPAPALIRRCQTEPVEIREPVIVIRIL